MHKNASWKARCMRGKTAPRAAGAIQHRQPRQMDAQTAEAPNIRCFRCLPKSAGIEKYTDSDSARSIRIPNVEEAALTEQLGETEPGKSALSFHRTGGETLDEAPLRKHEDHRDRDGRNEGGRHHVTPVRRCLAEERHHKNGGQRHRIEQVVPEPYRHCVRKH